MALPEKEVAGSHNTGEGFERRLKLYRENNWESKPDTAQSYFETVASLDVLLLPADSTADDVLMKPIEVCAEAGGKPANFHPTLDEAAALEQIAYEEAETKRIAAEGKESERLAAEAELTSKMDRAHVVRLEEIAKQEIMMAAAKKMPLRAFLVENVIPSLTEGLVEVCKLQPNDPHDYLSEWLIRNVEDTA